jgi:hypothetical protein
MSLVLCAHKCSVLVVDAVTVVQLWSARYNHLLPFMATALTLCSVLCYHPLHRQGSPERDRGAKGPDKLFKKIKANKLGAAEPRTVS